MIFGPLSEFDISRLTEKLDQFKAHYTIGVSQEDLAQSQEELRTRPMTPNPTYQRQEPYLFIEIADSLVSLVEDELEKMGAIPPAETSEELEHEEFLCTKCDYIAHVAGSCPKHGVALVDYSTWVASQGQGADKSIIAVVFVVLLAAAAYFTLAR